MSAGFLLVLCSVFFARATEVGVTAKKFQNALGQQNLQTVLMSIEERLRNLDSVYSMQYSPSVEGKLEHYGRKLEDVEAKITRMEAAMRNDLDKISENISSGNFKDDIAKDHVLRKIDSIYERINSRLVYAEIRLEMAERKLEDKLEVVLSRLDKMEDDISTKDANTAMEFADVISVLDDVKSSAGVIEAKLSNLTVLVNNTRHDQTELIRNKLARKTDSGFRADDLRKVNENLEGISLTNENFTATLRNEIKEDFNSFANKVVDFHDSSWKSYDRLERGLRSVATVVNLTRYDLQNGFRSLSVQIGKKQASPNMLGDSNKDAAILENLDKKIDSNFESVMMAQNLFMESCYRLQKDESQLETKISEVLEKLIDTFERKTVLQPKDLKNLEQMIRNHDANVRKSSGNLASSVGALSEKSDANRRRTEENLNAFRSTIEELYVLVQSKFGVYDENKLDEVILVLKDVRTHLLAIDAQIKQDAQRSILGVSEVKELKTILVQFRNATGVVQLEAAPIEKLQEYMKDVYHILYSMELKLNRSYLDYYFNKYNVEAVAHRFGKLLDEYVQNATGREIFETEPGRNITETMDGRQREEEPKLITAMFGQGNDTAPLNTNGTETTKLLLEIFGQGNDTQAIQKATVPSNTNRTAEDDPAETERKRKLIAEIFGQTSRSDANGTITEIFGTKPDQNVTGGNLGGRNCTIYDIDIRFSDGSQGGCLAREEETPPSTTVYSAYDIDVRLSKGNSPGGSKLNDEEAGPEGGETISYSEETSTEVLDYSNDNVEPDYEHEYDDRLD